MIVLDLSILNQKGTPMFNSDTFANRPAFGIVGRIFISTDTKEFYRDTGTSWELIGGPGSGTITGSGAATQVAFWNGTSSITGSNNLFWDSTNNYLGINTNTPTTALDVHHATNSGAIFNQTTATNNNTINFQTTGIGRWRIGNFYTAGADDFGVFDVVGSLQQFTIVNTTGQTFIGAKTTAAGKLVVNSATADAHLQIVGANAPSIRIDNAGSGGTQRFVFGLATATNNFIQGATAGQFCISTQSSGAMLFGMWQTVNATEAMRITTSNNLLIGLSVDGGQRLQVQGTTLLNGNVNISGSTTATSGTARGELNNATLVASANNDVLVGLDVNPTFTNGAFTGVANIALRVNGFLQASNFKTTVSSNPNTSTTVIIGTNVGSSITSENNICIGGVNNGIGRTTAQSLTTGQNNTIVGQGSASYITTGNQNSVLGSRALGGNSTTMSSNIALGDAALGNNTGSNNVSVGATSSLNVTSGSGNVFLGDNAARFQANGSTNLALTGNNNIYIGQQVRGFNNTDTNAIVIGSVGIGLGSNTTVIGNSSTTDTAIYGRMLVNYSSPVIGTYALDVNGTARVVSKLSLLGGTTSNAQINLASSTAPTSPNNGDIWFDGTNLFMRIGGSTKTFTII